MAIGMAERLEARVGGQATRRGLIPRQPRADRLIADIDTWLTREHGDEVRSSRRRTLPSGEVELLVGLHPAAPPLAFVASDPGRLTAAGETAVAGPGYHRFVGRILERLGFEVGVEWDEGDRSTFGDRATAEHGYLGWLGSELTRARSAVQRGARGVHLGMPPGTHVTTDGALATVLGPRSGEWLESAVGDSRIALDVTPWWADATDGRYLLNRALVQLWLEVRWRPPAVAGEADLLQLIHRTLSRAYPMDPALPFPWHEWSELCWLGGFDDQMARQAAHRAAEEPPPAVPIGYRRQPVRISHEGWALEIPGTFAERRTEEEWWGGGIGRSITLAATRTGSSSREPMPAAAFIAQYAGDLGPDALDHADDEVVGRARLTTDTTSGVEIAVLEGYSAVRGSGAAIRIEFHDADDWRWAIDMWRSLAPG